MKYTINHLKAEFPSNEACLDHIFKTKHPYAKGYTAMTKRKAYANSTGHQIHPLAGTIFEKSSTPLTTWFHVLFLFASSKNGVSAKEIQRQTGVTYKTAWRMGHQIRKLMEQGTDPLVGTVEVDETYFGPRGKNPDKFRVKTALMGMVERGGSVRVKKIPHRGTEVLLPMIKQNISPKAHLMTDEFRVYNKTPKLGYAHSSVKHGKRHWVHKGAHTNTIEGFWGQLKRSMRGTYHFVSSQHLQAYVDEFAWRYNERASSVPMFQTLVWKASR